MFLPFLTNRFAYDCDLKIKELDEAEKKSQDIEDLVVARRTAEERVSELDKLIVGLESKNDKYKLYLKQQMKQFDKLTQATAANEKVATKIEIMESVAEYFNQKLETAWRCLVTSIGGAFGILTGSVFVGMANGIGVPYIITSASAKAGRDAATTVMPLISASLYLAQFATLLILSAARHFTDVSSFTIAVFAAVLLAAVSFTIQER